MKGKFVVIEGIDGAGTEEQSTRLFEYLKSQGIFVERLTYPDYSKVIGRMIHEWLHSKEELPANTLFLVYTADMVKDIEKIKSWINEGKFVIADRYFTTTLAYQTAQGFPLEKALKFAELFEIPKPDMAIYLKVSPDVTVERKYKEKEELDRNEANKEFLEKVSKVYDDLVKNQVFTSWFVVDAEKSIEEVFDQIKKILRV
ncbi:MAG: dTMP kinase [Candidatus Aenigmatarchaeota archaeon]|nr:MAG: dTMP kinase [Candidatus Aenigmarchaeota archaeon]